MSFHQHPLGRDRNVMWVNLAVLLLTPYLVSEISAKPSEDVMTGNEFPITGAEFYRRSQFDAGEIRIFLKHTGKQPMSISELKVSRYVAGKDEKSAEQCEVIDYLYSKLSPPILMPGQNGELLVKLLNTPPDNSVLRCTVCGNMGGTWKTLIPTQQATLWIPYIGFSEDLSKVYVYVQNSTQMPLTIRLLEVAGINASDSCLSINNNLPPGDKGCLVFKMPVPLTLGEHVHIVVSAESGDQELLTHRIVRAVNKFPLLPETGFPHPKLGLDSESLFVQTMSCPAHDHGTHEEAARKFLDDYYRRFSQNPYLPIQMWICRADRPRAWYKFAALPDAAVMNPILLTSSAHESDTKASEQYHPFLWLATTAKRATEPNRYFACIPVNPEDGVFLHGSHTPDEIKFLVYCAIAAGAKGIIYRGTPSSDPLNQDAFVRLNRELQQLKPLLVIAEPVDWASTADDNYTARSLLCGNEAILVIVFDRRYFSEQQDHRFRTPAFAKSARPVKIQVGIPEGFTVSQVNSMYSPLLKELWNCSGGQLDFTANMVDSVQVYKVILRRENPHQVWEK